MSFEEDFIDDEYIEECNDPFEAKKIIDDDYDVVTDEKTIGFDEIFENIRCKITNLANYDHMMEEKVLDLLQKGKLR